MLKEKQETEIYERINLMYQKFNRMQSNLLLYLYSISVVLKEIHERKYLDKKGRRIFKESCKNIRLKIDKFELEFDDQFIKGEKDNESPAV